MSQDVKLLPCPFCGKDEHLVTEHLEGTIRHPAYRVRCDWCGASTGYTDKDCRADWNERANMAELLAENERLAEALRLALKWAEVLPTGEPLRAESVRDLDNARAALDQARGKGGAGK